MAESMVCDVGLSCTLKSHQHAAGKPKEGQNGEAQLLLNTTTETGLRLFSQRHWTMDKVLFEKELEACRTKTEDMSWLEILNYSVQPISRGGFDWHSGHLR